MLVKRRIHRSIGSIWRSRGRYIVSALCQEEILHPESPVRTSDQYITVLLVILWTQWLLLHRVKVVKIAVPKTVIADDQPPSTSSLRTDITSQFTWPSPRHDLARPFHSISHDEGLAVNAIYSTYMAQVLPRQLLLSISRTRD